MMKPLFLIALRTTRGQAACLNDLPTVMDHYDYLKEQIAPGEKFSALEQCKRAFGPNFVPHVQPNTPPFEVSTKNDLKI